MLNTVRIKQRAAEEKAPTASAIQDKPKGSRLDTSPAVMAPNRAIITPTT